MGYLRTVGTIDKHASLWHCIHAFFFPLLPLRLSSPQSVYRVARFDSGDRQTLPGTFPVELDEGLHLRVFSDIGPYRNYCVEIKLPNEIGVSQPVANASNAELCPPSSIGKEQIEYVRALFLRAIAPELSSSGSRDFKPVSVQLPTMVHSANRLDSANNQWEIESPAHFMVEGPHLPGVSERTIAGRTLNAVISMLTAERRELSQCLANRRNAFKGIGNPLFSERVTVERDTGDSPPNNDHGAAYTITHHPSDELLEERRWRFGVVDNFE